ncbi:ATP synthase subunit C lysine N-methyltransferase [Schistocerca nitens]|uniref:ATP synthase subunit C lysine N-methyltransferase n=1 Tax=Schistocerca nitens TaxID=7011 RepID=UPI0021184240|nr:ATP synthase subunit C lysine N-methyltransferase [Schistocerca nitens]
MEESRSKTGLLLVGITGGAAVAISFACAPFVSPALRRICLPYVPATTAQVQNVLTLLGKRKGNVIDLGSGDGRIVFAAAAAGFEAHGVELNPWLVTYSRLKAASLGLNKRTKFYQRDLWKFSIHGYKNIVVFGVEEMMPELEAKIKVEVSKDTHIIACRFPFPSWTPSVIVGSGIDKVWLYESEKI